MGLQQQLSRVFFSFRNHWHIASVISCFQNYVGHKNIGNIGDEIFNMTRETWKSGAVEGAMDMCAFVRVAEMSAAHKAFWLPLSQQSDTASDLGLIRSSIHNRKIAHVEKLLEHVGTYLLINVWCPSRFNNPDISRLMTHTYSKLTSWISRLGL